MIAQSQIFKWLGLLLFFGGSLSVAVIIASDPQNLLQRAFQQYTVYLERKLRLMFIWTPGRRIALAQGFGMVLILFVAAFLGLPYWYLFLAAVTVGPVIYIERLRRKRVAMIEQQLDGFLMALANALKSTPSLGDAFTSIQRLIPDPMRQEVGLAVKEMRVGSTLEQALLLMAGRIGSRSVDAALSAVLIGRQIGGNLPKVLDTTALTLREMARLEGVVRTKTAEGKAQLWVLAVFPLVLMYAFSAVQENYFAPLTQSFIGYLITIIAVGFWIASIVIARKILNVDI